MGYILVFFLLNMSISLASGPADAHATEETRQLFNLLFRYTRDPNKILFGQQQSTLFGAEGGYTPYYTHEHNEGTLGWTFAEKMVDYHYPDELCDVKALTGKYPAVVGFELGLTTLTIENVIDVRNAYLIKRAAKRGLFVTVSWHLINPVSGGLPWIKRDDKGVDINRTIQKILPGGSHHGVLRKRLDVVAEWLQTLTDFKGRLIPIIFRLFHEMNHSWFWWGRALGNTPDDYIQLYRFVVFYLRSYKNVHNILFVYSPDKFKSCTEYLGYYPGDDVVDLFGMDFYYTNRLSMDTDRLWFQHQVGCLVQISKRKGKPVAITEVGMFDNGINTYHNFYNDHVLDLLKTGNGTTQIAYLFAWANLCTRPGPCDLKVPFRGHPAAEYFLTFSKDPMMVFSNGVSQAHPEIKEIFGPYLLFFDDLPLSFYHTCLSFTILILYWVYLLTAGRLQKIYKRAN